MEKMKNLISIYANNTEIRKVKNIVFCDEYFLLVTEGEELIRNNANQLTIGKKYHIRICANGLKMPLSNDMFYIKRVENNAHESFSGLIPITYKYFFYKA